MIKMIDVNYLCDEPIENFDCKYEGWWIQASYNVYTTEYLQVCRVGNDFFITDIDNNPYTIINQAGDLITAIKYYFKKMYGDNNKLNIIYVYECNAMVMTII